MLRLTKVSTFYGWVKALDEVSLEVERGEIVTIIGANGAGKTTLLKSIAGIIRPAEGKISFENNDVTMLSAPDLVKRGISLVPEGRQLFPSMTVEDNLILGSYLRSNKKAIHSEIEKVYDLFPRLKERRKQLAGTLSGGEQQMAAIGRSLLSGPTLLLLDEPTMGLAPQMVSLIFDVIMRLNKEGVTILLVEQNARAALAMAGRGYVLVNGKVRITDSAKNLLRNENVKKSYLGYA